MYYICLSAFWYFLKHSKKNNPIAEILFKQNQQHLKVLSIGYCLETRCSSLMNRYLHIYCHWQWISISLSHWRTHSTLNSFHYCHKYHTINFHKFIKFLLKSSQFLWYAILLGRQFQNPPSLIIKTFNFQLSFYITS